MTDSLKDQKRNAILVKGMIATEGWKVVLAPELEDLKQRKIRFLIAEDDENIKRDLQGELRAIIWLQDRIEHYDKI